MTRRNLAATPAHAYKPASKIDNILSAMVLGGVLALTFLIAVGALVGTIGSMLFSDIVHPEQKRSTT